MSANLYAEWLRQKAGTLGMAAYKGDLLSIANAIDRYIAERDEARAFGEKAAKAHNDLLADQRILRCAFCDAKYPPDTPPTQHEALTAHVAVCPKHPMRAIEAERDALRADAEWIEQALFERKWSGTLGESSQWHLVGSWRHIVHRMRGETLREAIDAARGTRS